MENLERQNLKETACGIRNANLLLTGTVWLVRSHEMICGAWLERSQPYPVCEMGEVMGGSQCWGPTWGQHCGNLRPGLDRPEGTGNIRVIRGGLRATCALGWWTDRGRALGTCSVVSWDPCGEQGRIRTNNARNWNQREMTSLPTQEKKENFKTHETSKTHKTRGPFSSSFASSFVSIFARIYASLFVCVIASLLASVSANNKTSLTASFIASFARELCYMFRCQELCYSLQRDRGNLQNQPDKMMIQLMSLLALQKEQGITLQYEREKEEMRLSACYLICSFGSAQINSSPC